MVRLSSVTSQVTMPALPPTGSVNIGEIFHKRNVAALLSLNSIFAVLNNLHFWRHCTTPFHSIYSYSSLYCCERGWLYGVNQLPVCIAMHPIHTSATTTPLHNNINNNNKNSSCTCQYINPLTTNNSSAPHCSPNLPKYSYRPASSCIQRLKGIAEVGTCFGTAQG